MKKHLIGWVAVALVITGLTSAIAYAQITPSSMPTSGGPIMINIDQNGNAMLRGEIESVGADFLIIKSWGSSLKVRVLMTTQIISKNATLSDFKAGDVAGVLGSIAQDGSFIVNAEVVRAWGQRSDGDNDDIPDIQDKDDDNDSILDVNEIGKANDHDNDGVTDAQDIDDDNDGVEDANEVKKVDDEDCVAGDDVEEAFDHDNDGMDDAEDNDDDGDGILDTKDAKSFDRDNDGENDDVDKND